MGGEVRSLRPTGCWDSFSSLIGPLCCCTLRTQPSKRGSYPISRRDLHSEWLLKRGQATLVSPEMYVSDFLCFRGYATFVSNRKLRHQANSSSRSAKACGARIIASWPDASVRQLQCSFGDSVRRNKVRRINEMITPRPVHSIYV